MKAPFGAMEAPTFSSEGSPPRAMEAHPLDMETPLEPLRSQSITDNGTSQSGTCCTAVHVTK
jgi:hypothetical protein